MRLRPRSREADAVFQELRTEILCQGEFPSAGLKVPEDLRRFGVQEPFIDEAVDHLLAEGLVQLDDERLRRPKIEPNELRAIFGIRYMIDCLGACELADRLRDSRQSKRRGDTERRLEGLREVQAKLERLCARRSRRLIDVIDGDCKFHVEIAVQSGYASAVPIIRWTFHRILIATPSFRSPQRAQGIVDEHRMVLSAIGARKGSPVNVCQAIREHLLGGARAWNPKLARSLEKRLPHLFALMGNTQERK